MSVEHKEFCDHCGTLVNEDQWNRNHWALDGGAPGSGNVNKALAWKGQLCQPCVTEIVDFIKTEKT